MIAKSQLKQRQLKVAWALSRDKDISENGVCMDKVHPWRDKKQTQESPNDQKFFDDFIAGFDPDQDDYDKLFQTECFDENYRILKCKIL